MDDVKTISDRLYYQLKQVDLDCRFSYSDVVHVKTKHKNIVQLRWHSDSDEVHITHQKLDRQYTFNLYNATGTLVLSQPKYSGEETEIALNNIENGLLFYIIENAHRVVELSEKVWKM
jgi:hypothetical protein